MIVDKENQNTNSESEKRLKFPLISGHSRRLTTLIDLHTGKNHLNNISCLIAGYSNSKPYDYQE